MPKDVPRFWRVIPQRYNMLGNRCGACERVYFPPRESCPYCRRMSIGKMKDLKLSGKGEILTYTIIHVGSEDFEDQVPYPVAIIQLDEGPKVTGQIVDCDNENIHIGMRVESTFRKIQQDSSTGAIYYGYKFTKCKEKNKKNETTIEEQVVNPL